MPPSSRQHRPTLTAAYRPQGLTIRRSALVYVAALLAAIAFGYLVAGPVFWKLEANEGSDIHAYVLLYRRYSALLEGNVQSLLGYVLMEVHFHYWFEQLSEFLGGPLDALQWLAFASAAVIVLACQNGKQKTLLLSLVILAHPRALALMAAQQRMAVSLAVFLVATNFRNPLLRYGLFALAISFHTYAIVLVGAYVLYDFVLNRRYSVKWNVVAVVITVGIVLVTVVLRDYALQQLGDRRAELSGSGGTGLLYTLMWVLTGAAIHALAPRFLFTPFGAMFYMLLASGAVAAALNLYSERYFAIAVVALAAAQIDLKGHRLAGFMAVYGLNLALSMYFWL